MKLLEVKKPPLLFAYFNHSYVQISAQTLRRWTAERAQNKVLRNSVMDEVKTIKKEYLPGKLCSGSRLHCAVAILMFLIVTGSIPDVCFPIAAIRTYKTEGMIE